MEEDRKRWDDRYGQPNFRTAAPSAFVASHVGIVGPRVLDIAGGNGRNALFLARSGAHVDIIDISITGLQQARLAARAEGLSVSAVAADLEHYPLPEGLYDTVINVRYLQRSLFLPIQLALKPGGILLFETFLLAQSELIHVRNPQFLLHPGELRAAFSSLEVLEYQEGLLDGDPPAYLAQLVARRPRN